jgi:hypothetical protein
MTVELTQQLLDIAFPAGFTVALAPPSGAIAFELRKNPAEMALVDETAYESNLRQPKPVSEQQSSRLFYPFSDQPLMRGYAHRLAECACEIARRQSTFTRELCDGGVV